MDAKQKTAFRKTKTWKNFRRELVEKRGRTCELCGMKYIPSQARKIQVHHKDPEHYDDLNEEKFKCLCSSCHGDIVEKVASRLKSKRGFNPPNKDQWMALIGEFLPFS